MAQLKICQGRHCSDHGSKYLADRAQAECPSIDIEMCGCLGQCEQAANVVLDGTIHHKTTGPKLAEILKKST